MKMLYILMHFLMEVITDVISCKRVFVECSTLTMNSLRVLFAVTLAMEKVKINLLFLLLFINIVIKCRDS